MFWIRSDLISAALKLVAETDHATGGDKARMQEFNAAIAQARTRAR